MEISACWHNGRVVDSDAASPSIASMSLHMGLAVFDGMMAYGNGAAFHVLRKRKHVERLVSGASNLGFAPRYSVDEISEAIDALLEGLDPHETYYIRPIAYRGSQHLWLTEIDDVPVDLAIIAAPAVRNVDAGLRMQVSRYQRVSSAAMPVQWKTAGSYVNSYLCRQTAAADGYDDGIMLDDRGRLAEASAANLFLIRGETVLTPALNGDVFPGITRGLVLDLADTLGVELVEQALYPSDLTTADAAFIGSTLLEMRPIDEVGGVRLNSSENVSWSRLKSAFRDVTASPSGMV